MLTAQTFKNKDVRFDPFDIEEDTGVIYGIYGYTQGELVNTEIEYPEQFFTTVILEGKPSPVGVVTDTPHHRSAKLKEKLQQWCLTTAPTMTLM